MAGYRLTVLGLELGEREGALRLYNPNTRTWLEPSRDRVAKAETRAQDAETRALMAEKRAQEEAQARQNLETELAKAQEDLKRLQQ